MHSSGFSKFYHWMEHSQQYFYGCPACVGPCLSLRNCCGVVEDIANFGTQCPLYVLIQGRLLGVSGPDITVSLNEWFDLCCRDGVTHGPLMVCTWEGPQGPFASVLCTNLIRFPVPVSQFPPCTNYLQPFLEEVGHLLVPGPLPPSQHAGPHSRPRMPCSPKRLTWSEPSLYILGKAPGDVFITLTLRFPRGLGHKEIGLTAWEANQEVLPLTCHRGVRTCLTFGDTAPQSVP